MNKTQKMKSVLLSALCFSALAITITVTAVGKTNAFSPLSAADCPHTHVEHYHGLNALDGYVEHWACCECHTAWADESRLVPIGNTTDNRDKIDFETLCTYQSQGTAEWMCQAAEPVYDEEQGFVFKNYLVDLNAGQQNEFATINSNFTLEDKGYDYFGGTITNKTSTKLTGNLHVRDWNGGIRSITLDVGESIGFFVSAEDWKATKVGDNYGFAFLLQNVSNAQEGDYVELSKPKFFNGKTNFNEFFADIQRSSDWNSFGDSIDDTYGITKELFVPQGKDVYICGRVVVDTNQYTAVKFRIYNGMSTDTNSVKIYNICEVGHEERQIVTDVGVLKALQWNEVTVPADSWNGDTRNLIVVQHLNSSGAVFKFTDFQFVEKGAPYVCFGDGSNEEFTFQDSSSGGKWPAAEKIVDQEKGKAFKIDCQGLTSIATNNKPHVASEYSTVEFYVYNGCDADFTMYSTSDWAVYTQYGTLAKDTWTYCSMSVAEFNKGTTFFSPSGNPSGEVLITYFVAK